MHVRIRPLFDDHAKKKARGGGEDTDRACRVYGVPFLLAVCIGKDQLTEAPRLGIGTDGEAVKPRGE